MSSDRTGKIDEIARSALEREPAERRAFLDEACGADATLRSRVDARVQGLESQSDQTKTIPMQARLSGLGDRETAEPGASLVGTFVAHYRLLEKLGEGGMGEIYLAEDLKLRRRVAIKALPTELVRNPVSRRRFVREARAAGAVAHPHVAAIYGIEEVGERVFIAMEYVQGRNLRHVLRSGPLELDRALRIGTQLAEALASCHERGVVHRDLKPDNVLISDEGHPMVIDFGLARLLEKQPTVDTSGSAGLTPAEELKTAGQKVMGTLAYMAPEQARGGEVGVRSDVFSLGVLIYELVTGVSPFKRETAVETLSAVLHDPPPPLQLEPAATVRELDRILTRALAKEPDDRHPSMRELAADLRQGRERLAARRRRAPAWLAAAALAIAAVSSSLAIWVGPEGSPAAEQRGSLSVLVADFQNDTDDPVFEGVLEQALAIGLEGTPFITSFDRPRARRSASRLDPDTGGELDARLARLVGRSEGIDVVLEGRIAGRSGDGYAIQARAVDTVSAETLAEAEARAGSRSEVLKATQAIAARLAEALGDSETEPAREFVTTRSLEALHAFADAQELLRQGRYDDAAAAYREATEHDPGFGLAYGGLAVLLYNQGERAEAERYFRQAMSHVDRMSERERRRARGAYFVLSGSYDKAIEEFEALVETYPADYVGHSNLALACLYTRDTARALAHGRRALEIYPKNVVNRNNLALYALYAGDFESAEREARHVLEVNPGFEKAHVVVAMAQLARGKPDEAARIYEGLRPVSALGASLAATGLADLALYQGRLADAREILLAAIEDERGAGRDEAAARKRTMLAQALAGLGRSEEAAAALEEAVAASRQSNVRVPAARIFAALGDAARARELASELAARVQREPRAYAKLIEAEVELRGGRPSEAVQLFRDSLALTDTWLGRFGLARAYVAAGAFVEAHAELERCLERRGEAAAVFLDDLPTWRYRAEVSYYAGRAREGLGSPDATLAYREYLHLKGSGRETPLVADARRRLAALE